MAKILQVAHADIIFENFEGDLVILDLRSGRYFGCNPLAATLWNVMIGGTDPNDLIAAGLSQDRLDAFVARLAELGLAFMQDGAAVPFEDISKADLTGDEEPQIIGFDDLADLMQADPIHDVDTDFGWPHRRADG